MKTEATIRNKEISLTCPKRAFIQSEIPGGVQKYRNLSRIFMDVMNAIPLNAARDQVANQINMAFAMAPAALISFEERSEKRKMFDLIMRYLYWESCQMKQDILAQNFKVVVPFDGEETEVFVHRLFDRGEYYEAAVYAYKKPDLKPRGRKFQTQPKNSIRLLLLYRAAEKKLSQLRKLKGEAAVPLKPVYGTIFYMRSENDSKEFLPFDEKNDQAISWSFSPSEAGNIEQTYHNVHISADEETCSPSNCNGCPCFDLCKTEFVPKAKITLPPPEIKPINEIHLTQSQEEFVEFTKGECRVNAVAGSGKTTIVTLRTINLMELGVKPEEILMLTFTDKACGEMRQRIERYLKGSALNNLHLDLNALTIETFNSWGQLILSQYFDKLGFTTAPQIIDDIQKKDILIDILERHHKLPVNYNEPFLNTQMAMGAVVEIGKLIDTMKAAHVENEADILNIPKLHSKFRPLAAELLEIFTEYNQALVNLNLIDFEDQLRLILQLKQFGVFQNLPYKHIIVDEFQDTNKNQIDLLREMMAENQGIESLAVVGDEMQAIYGFRDASPENLIEFKRYFPNMKDFYLEENFRSQGPIITLANNILSKEAKIKKVIKAQKQSSQVQPVLMIKDDPKDEIAFYVRVVENWIKDDGLEPSSIAILGHTRSELRAYEQALTEAGIPCMMKVPEILKDCAYVKGILAFAKWLHDPSQLIHFALYAKMAGQDPFDVPALQKSSESLKKLFDDAADDATRRGLFFSFLEFAQQDYIGEYFLKTLEEKSSIHTFAQLVEYLVKYDHYGIQEPHSTAKEAADAVTLITIHSAKGLEWDNILLSLKRFRETDEEKRLMYVAITRAKERLIVTYPQKQGLVRLLRD